MKYKKKKVTLDDIARELNISKNAVSIALSNKPGVSEKTREMIINKAYEMGYKVKQKQERGYIGLLVSNIVLNDPHFFSTLLYSIENSIRIEGYDFTLFCYSDQNQEYLEQFLNQDNLKGLIILSKMEEDVIEKIALYEIPIVLVDHRVDNRNIDTINTDNINSTRMAIRYLIKKGYNEIGFIGDISCSPSYKERWQGFLQAYEESNLKVNLDFCKVDGFKDFTKNPEPEIIEFIKNLKNLPQAFFCVSDLSTLLTANFIKELGYQIPKDIGILGFDDTEMIRYFKPSLSMIHIDRTYYGKRAVKRLIEKINNPDDPTEDIRISCRINFRKSLNISK
ncbi:LacI family DNA-binding transcriptional regulator [Caldicellulosiruptoraceae bacterium PP1]